MFSMLKTCTRSNQCTIRPVFGSTFHFPLFTNSIPNIFQPS